MKTKLLAAVIATCFAAPVLAQSSVTMYGIVDAGVMWQKGGPTRLVSGIADGSRLGFKGTEDIGGGYKAIFNLEARVELDNGSQKPTLLNDNQGFYLTRGMGPLSAPLGRAFQVKGAPAVNAEGALFDRTTMVGLITPVGAVLMGRMYTPGYEVFAAADAFETGTAGTWGGITGGTAGYTALGADIRSSRSIQYRIATPAGFGGSLMYGFKGSGYLNRYNKFLGAAMTYKANGLDVGIAQNRGYDQGDAVSLVTTTLGGSYTMGDYKFFAGYHDQRNRNSALLREYIAGYDAAAPLLLGAPTAAALRPMFVTNITRNTQVDAASFQLGIQIRLGAGRVMASVAHQNDRSASDSDANQFALGYDYNLSKRTDLYTVVAQINNRNEAQYTPGAAGSPGGFTRDIGGTGRAFQVGVRHRF
jgi:predicted porin